MSGVFYRSLGLEIMGSKNDRTSLAVLDFYPKTGRLVVSDVEPRVKGHNETGGDEALLDSIRESVRQAPQLTGLGVHGPLSLPPYFAARGRKLPVARPADAESRWMDAAWKRLRPHPRPFSPYLQRGCEVWMRYLTPERFLVPDALGSNAAPIAARMQFLLPHLPTPCHEVYPRATLLRIVSSLGLSKSLARDYSDFHRGLEAREEFFKQLAKKLPAIFFYDRDHEKMISQLSCFNAFLAALTQHLWHRQQTERPPRGFPRAAGWIHIPHPKLDWEAALGS